MLKAQLLSALVVTSAYQDNRDFLQSEQVYGNQNAGFLSNNMYNNVAVNDFGNSNTNTVVFDPPSIALDQSTGVNTSILNIPAYDNSYNNTSTTHLNEYKQVINPNGYSNSGYVNKTTFPWSKSVYGLTTDGFNNTSQNNSGYQSCGYNCITRKKRWYDNLFSSWSHPSTVTLIVFFSLIIIVAIMVLIWDTYSNKSQDSSRKYFD